MALARRIIVVSPDNDFGRQLAAALAPVVGRVDVHESLGSLDSIELHNALCVIHLDGELGPSPRELLRPLVGCTVIAVLPRSNLGAVVGLMQASDHVVGVIVAEDVDQRQLSAMAIRILTDDVFGLQKLMAPGSQIHTQIVNDYRDKAACMSQVTSFVEQLGAPQRYVAPIEQCIDEMMMNALYDAPVDSRGRHIFAGVPTATRITMRSEQSVVVQYAYDGKRFAIAVRDAFGSLDNATVVRYLHKSLHDAQPVDRKAGGAGLGLYLMVSSATAVYFHVLPGIATEVVCMFDLEAPRLRLEQFGFFVQADAAGRVATGPSRRVLASQRRRLMRALAVLLATLFVVLGVFVLRRVLRDPEAPRLAVTTRPQGAAIDIGGRSVGVAADGTLVVRDLLIGRPYSVVARLDGHEEKRAVVRLRAGANAVTFELQALATAEIDTEPSGAELEIDGNPMGTTPAAVTSLPPGSTVSIVFARPGYRTATARLEIPQRGKSTRLVQRLELSDAHVRVRFVSNPPGAAIVPTGQLPGVDRTYTPAELFLAADELQRFTLVMPKYRPLVIEPFAPQRGSDRLVKGGNLVKE